MLNKLVENTISLWVSPNARRFVGTSESVELERQGHGLVAGHNI